MQLAAFRHQILRGGSVAAASGLKLIALMQEERLILATMGPECMVNFASNFSGSTSSSGSVPAANSADALEGMAFVPGKPVRLYSLQARPELNGCTGVVMKAFDPNTGRVVVMLDTNTDNVGVHMEMVIIAVKTANLLLLTLLGG